MSAFDGYAYAELVDALKTARGIVHLTESIIASGSSLSRDATIALEMALRTIALIESELARRATGVSKM